MNIFGLLMNVIRKYFDVARLLYGAYRYKWRIWKFPKCMLDVAALIRYVRKYGPMTFEDLVQRCREQVIEGRA